MAGTIFKLGWTNPLTDVFGAHPVLGPVLDLDDGVTFTLAAPGIELPPPPHTLVTAGNVRTQGERATRAVYRHNRQVVAHVLAGPMASYADLAANVRALVSWLAGPPSIPFTIQCQPSGAAAPVYIDVVGAAHDIPTDESQWLRLQLEPVELVFVARPGLRSDRVTLQNLIPNPGFEAPSGPGVLAFADPLANTNAYSVVSGSAPTLGPANTYADSILADGPSRYYRLDETSGSTADDVAGSGSAGTLNSSITKNAASLLSGDADPAMTFGGATGYRNGARKPPA